MLFNLNAAQFQVQARSGGAIAQTSHTDQIAALREARGLVLEAVPVGGGVSHVTSVDSTCWTVRDRAGATVAEISVSVASQPEMLEAAA